MAKVGLPSASNLGDVSGSSSGGLGYLLGGLAGSSGTGNGLGSLLGGLSGTVINSGSLGGSSPVNFTNSPLPSGLPSSSLGSLGGLGGLGGAGFSSGSGASGLGSLGSLGGLGTAGSGTGSSSGAPSLGSLLGGGGSGSSSGLGSLSGLGGKKPHSKGKLGLTQIGETASDIQNGVCKSMTFICARGTTESGNLGGTVCPDLANKLKSDLNGDVAVQGVNYPADVEGAVEGGISPKTAQGSTDMAQLTNQALQKCPNTKVVLAGYSQGAEQVHGALQNMDAGTTGKIAVSQPVTSITSPQ